LAEDSSIPENVTALADANPRIRMDAARALYVAGVTLCEPALAEWREDKEFDELLVRAPHEFSAWRTVVGIAVKPASFEAIRLANDSPRLAEVPADEDAREFEIHCKDGTELDILSSRNGNAEGPIGKFVEKFGEGIQQIEIYVLDVARATAILHSRFGVVSIYPKPRGGANGTKMNFILAKGDGGKKVLIELVEEKAAE
jgi:hypothetical protein